MHWFIRFLAIIVVSNVNTILHADTSKPVLIGDDFSSRVLGTEFYYFEDKESRFDHDSISSQLSEFRRSDKASLNFGFTASTYWLFGRLENQNRAGDYLLVFDYPLLDHVDIFISQNGNLIKEINTGDQLPFDQRGVNHRKLNAVLDLESDQVYDIFIRVKSASSFKMGLTLFHPEVFWESQQTESNLNLLYFGALTVMVIYNAIIFLITRSRSYMYYVLYMGFFVIFQSGIAGYDYQYLWPEAIFFHEKVVPFSVTATLFFLGLFTYQFLDLKESNPRLGLLVLGMGSLAGINSVASFFLPYKIAVIGAALMGILVSTTCVIPAIVNFRKSIDARLYFLAFSCFLIGCLAFGLQNFGVLPNNIFTDFGPQIGSAVEVILLSVALANRIRKLQQERIALFEKIQQMNRDLEKEVKRKTKKVQSLLDTIHQGIISISGPTYTIGGEYSKAAASIIGEKTLKNTSFEEVFLSRCQTSNDGKDRVMAALSSAMGEDVINFETNSDHLPDAISFINGNNQKIELELDWAVECNSDDEVETIVLTFKDVTELLKLKDATEKSRQELELLSEIISLEKSTFVKFCRKGQKLIEENLHLALASDSFSAASVKMMFINFHTLKGNARQINLSELVDMAHDTEQYYSDLLVDKTQWDKQKAIDELQASRSVLEKYIALATQKLRWQMDEGEMILLERNKVGTMLESLVKSLDAPDQLKTETLSIYSLFSEKYYFGIGEILKEFYNDIERMARDLGKENPSVSTHGLELRVNREAARLLQDVLVHMIRNSMDHGLETKEDRIRFGKSKRGTISVSVQEEGVNYYLMYGDDGRGLDLDRIAEKSKLIDPDIDVDKLSDKEKAELIFLSGVSTASGVSDISGRGVGMCAIRSFLEGLGASIELELGPRFDYGPGESRCSVTFRILIPSSMIDPFFYKDSPFKQPA
ncbi:MAG: hypothetical protein HRU19_20895 [Pseudobacteriovorax sp.]|nr:hypothetical protein [Pseudobacteriovorax sp.]